MPNRDETLMVPDSDGNSETEAQVESGRSATEDEREDPSRGPRSGTSNGDVSVESDSEIRGA